MTTGTGELSENIFWAIMVIFVCAMLFNVGASYTSRTKEYFAVVVLSIMLITQLYQVLKMAEKIPPSWDGLEVSRNYCLQSNKGGKRGTSDKSVQFYNPCFCLEGYRCHIDGALQPNTSVCTRGTQGHTCTNPITNALVDPYISNRRDCRTGQGAVCSFDEPCVPCELELAILFTNKDARCQTCMGGVDSGCHFVDGLGPYCWASPDTREVVPCTQCCTEPPDLLFDNVTGIQQCL